MTELDLSTALLLSFLFFVMALLYSSVGHAGASGYLAAMGFLGITSAIMKPTALILNIAAAAIASFQFFRAGFFSWRLFWPFALTSIPFAFLGGWIVIPSVLYRQVIGVILAFCAFRLFFLSKKSLSDRESFSIPVSLFIGALIGFLSGAVGVGGGIFLSPLLLLFTRTEIKKVSAVAALFILVNSLSGLAGLIARAPDLPIFLPLWLIAASAGSWIGSTYGSGKVPPIFLRRLLSVVLVIAAVKLLFF